MAFRVLLHLHICSIHLFIHNICVSTQTYSEEANTQLRPNQSTDPSCPVTLFLSDCPTQSQPAWLVSLARLVHATKLSMASKKSATGFLCLVFLIFNSCNQGTALYFSQNTLTLNRSYVADNSTVYTAQSILEPDDTGDISYRIAPSHTKQSCPHLSVHPTSGSIYVKAIPKGFQNANTTCKYTVTSNLNGVAGLRDITTDSLRLIMKTTERSSDENAVDDCKNISLEEICFDGLSSLELQIMENSVASQVMVMGNTIQSCQNKIPVQYVLDAVGEDIMSIRGDNSNGSSRQSLWIKSNLDREATSFYNFSITCSVAGGNLVVSRNMTLPGTLTVLDQDDNPPESQKGTQHVTIYIDLRLQGNLDENARLNSLEANDHLYIDRDIVEVNNFEITALNDTREILNFQMMKVAGAHTTTKSTAVILQLSLKKSLKDVKSWNDEYCVAVVINDTTLVKKMENSEMHYTVCLHWGHRTVESEQKADLTDEELKSLLSNGIYEARFPRKSSMHALVMYPFPDLIRDISEIEMLPNLDFRIEKLQLFSHEHEDLAPSVYYGAGEQTNNPFAVTSRTGIIYATNPSFLRDASMKHISLRLSWNIPTNGSSHVENRSYGANVTIVLDGDTYETGNNGTVPCDVESCAEFSESHKCESSCGFGSLKNCVWVPRQTPIEQNSITAPINTTVSNLDYATCSASVETCPDGKCDELEFIQPFRCPQDCVTDVTGISILRQRVNGKRHGIKSGTGVCTCHTKTSCSCAHLPLTNKQVSSNSSDAPSTPGTSAEPSPRHFHASTSYTEQPKLGPIQTPDACGKICIVFLVTLVVFLLIIVVFIVYVYRSRVSTRRKSRNVKPNMSINPAGMVVSGMYGHGLPMDNGNNMNDPDYLRAGMDSDTYNGRTNAHYGCGDYLMVDTKWEIQRNSLLLEQVLGEGEFGRVLKGKAHNLPNHEGILDVAVKMLKDNNSENGKSCKQEFMAEFSLLQQVDHPNVIKLLGACTSPGGPPLLVMEYAEMGSLRSFLRKCRRVESVGNGSSGAVWSDPQSPSNPVLTFHSTPAEQDAYLNDSQYIVTPQEVLGFSWQIAKGMAYLSDMKMVHRDLAARNILLTKAKVCKISDFGLTRDIYVDDAYKKKSKDRVPVKWLAPECLADELYTTKSDVWAFGILLWELATLGASPYPGIQNEQLYQLLKSGYRMQQPVNCSAELYELMLYCWAGEVTNRPNFHQLVNSISKLLEDGIEYLKLDIPTVNNPGYDYFLQEERPTELKEVTTDAQISQAGQPKVGADGSMENLRLIDHEISTNEDFESNSTGYNNFVHTYINEPKSVRESRRKIPVNSGYESPIKVVTPISKE